MDSSCIRTQWIRWGISVKTIKGDLVALAQDGKFDIIVHGCNCLHTMGAGIALQLANTFPGPLGPATIDRLGTKLGDRDKLGSFTIANGVTSLGKIFAIVNGYTQYDFGSTDGVAPVDYDAIRDVFRGLAELCTNAPDVRIGYPAIGAGLAGGNWDRIAAIIDEELEGFDHTYVEYESVAAARTRVANTLRQAQTEDLFYDPWMNYTGAADDECLQQQEDRIEEVINAMGEAAQLLEKIK